MDVLQWFMECKISSEGWNFSEILLINARCVNSSVFLSSSQFASIPISPVKVLSWVILNRDLICSTNQFFDSSSPLNGMSSVMVHTIVVVVLFVNPHAVRFCDSCARVSFYTYYICLIAPYHLRFLVNLVCSVTNWCRGQNYILYFTPRSVFL